MYNDELYNPAFNDDINSLDEKERLKEEIKALKAVDKNYVKETRKIKMEKTNKKGEKTVYYKLKYIDLYGSKGIGHKIRNATNGFYTEDIVGSKDEYQYFVVNDSRGLNGHKEPLTLYFDSPEQYELHCLVELNAKVKDNWHKRFRELTKNN